MSRSSHLARRVAEDDWMESGAWDMWRDRKQGKGS